MINQLALARLKICTMFSLERTKAERKTPTTRINLDNNFTCFIIRLVCFIRNFYFILLTFFVKKRREKKHHRNSH